MSQKSSKIVVRPYAAVLSVVHDWPRSPVHAQGPVNKPTRARRQCSGPVFESWPTQIIFAKLLLYVLLIYSANIGITARAKIAVVLTPYIPTMFVTSTLIPGTGGPCPPRAP